MVVKSGADPFPGVGPAVASAVMHGVRDGARYLLFFSSFSSSSSFSFLEDFSASSLSTFLLIRVPSWATLISQFWLPRGARRAGAQRRRRQPLRPDPDRRLRRPVR